MSLLKFSHYWTLAHPVVLRSVGRVGVTTMVMILIIVNNTSSHPTHH